MDINGDFSKRAFVHSDKLPWTPSPIPGIERRMLDRLGNEVARATTIVRYAPNSQFAPHVHTGGEEFFVLDGVFQDEHGDFPAGSYVRNPPLTEHTPGSQPGCTIFVKLWQFNPDDRTQIRLDTNNLEYVADTRRPGVETMKLFQDDIERVCLERWAANQSVTLEADAGLELLVLDGALSEGNENFEKHDWLRLPKGTHQVAIAGTGGARVWIKRGHLAHDPVPPTI